MSSPPTAARIAVLGAGITGLTAAWHLRRAGLTVVVFEQGARVGGAIGAVRADGWLHELGPNSLLENSPEIGALLDELGLASRRLYAAPAAKQRYIVRGGRLVAMPTSPLAFLTTPLFSLRAKLKLAGEPWRGPRFDDVRIVKDIYPPRISLSFRLTDAEGNVVKEGKRELRDLAFMMKINMSFRDDSVRYEKALLDDWLRAEFPRVRKS